MKTKITVIALMALMFCFIPVARAGETAQPLKEVYIKHKQVSWQTYEFFVLTNLDSRAGLNYEWNVNNKETFNAERVRYFFPRGEHLVKLKVEDKYGNVKYDSVKLSICFWSLKNNWFWWALYLIVVLIIVYYWAIKIIYLFNRRKVSREVRYFMDILDEHGWVERMVAEHLRETRRTRKQENKKTRN